MINRADTFWAWVWDTEGQKKWKRLVLLAFEDGSCIAVGVDDIDKCISVNGTDTWFHYERIPEPKKRLMTREEILGFIAWNPHIVIRFKDNHAILPQRLRVIYEDIDKFEWAPITEAGEIGEWSNFYKEVEE